MNFKIGQKVVCVFQGHEAPVISEVPCPKFNEIYTVLGFPPQHPKYMTLVELGPDVGALQHFFRPIDYSFGERIAEEITESVEVEELTITV
jgi:hypothetical protein